MRARARAPGERSGAGARVLVAGALAALVLALALAGCGGSSDPQLDVSAAASLRAALPRYSAGLHGVTVRYSFAGSDALAAQIEQGVRPSVFASANTKLPDLLYAKHLVQKPVVFAANKLVIAVPRGSRITSLADLERPGTTISIGTPTVPVGDYTTSVLLRMAPARRAALLANVRDRESDVTGIVGKLTQGAVDAGFLYVTDVRAAGGQLRAIALPASLQPVVAYGAAVVNGGPAQAQARAYVTGLTHGAGQEALLAAGFLPPPK